VETVLSRINDAGDVSGAYSTVQLTFDELLGDNPITPRTTPRSDVYDFVLFNNGSFTSFLVPLGLGGLPLGINARGNVVGVYDDAAGSHGFLGSRQ
jgi:hypothetical protein